MASNFNADASIADDGGDPGPAYGALRAGNCKPHAGTVKLQRPHVKPDLPARSRVFPIAHRASLTVALPHGSARTLPAGLPGADAVVPGTGAHDRLQITRRKIRDAWEAGEKDLFEVRTRWGRKTRCSAGHRFYRPEGWVRLENLRVGMSIAAPRMYGEPRQRSKIGEALPLERAAVTIRYCYETIRARQIAPAQ